MNEAEFIVVGAGSAGCVLAARLARSLQCRVVVVEPPAAAAPQADRERPSRWLHLLKSTEDWDLQTDSIARLANRSLGWPRGRGLGGSSRINAMIWFPPADRDWKMLQAASGGRWSIDTMNSSYESVVADVKPERPRWLSEASQRFVRTAEGIPGADPMVYQRLNRDGRRWNPAEMLASENRIQIVRAAVHSVIFDHDRAKGVRVVDGSSTGELVASKGVVLCAGVIATPSILMRSGIGARDALTRHGINVRSEQPNVGENLRDHLIMPVVFRADSSSPFSDTPTLRDVVRWQALGTGPIASNIAECGGLFADGRFQIHLTPTHYLTFPENDSTAAMTIGVNVTDPASSGSIALGSCHAHDPPRISPNYLHDGGDLEGTIQAVRLARTIATRHPLCEWVGSELLPGVKRDTDDSIARSISRYAQTLYHPVGTCAVGSSADAVVSPDFALRGCERLWIADASLFPRLTTGNPNAAVMTLAAMAAESIAGIVDGD